jgi:Tol biopolymer transport system component
VVSTTGGKVIRYLTGAIGGTFSFTLSEDGDTVWFTDNDTCQGGLHRVPYRGGAAIKVSGAVNGEGLTVSPDGSKIAYQPFSCPAPSSVAIAVLDLRTGQRRTWWSPSMKETLESMTWSSDGRHLAYVELSGTGEGRTRASLLDTASPGTSLAASWPVPAPD